MAWDQLLFLAGAMPKLEELHCSGNKVSSLTPPSGVDMAARLPAVHSLFLEGNELATWEAVTPLGALPSLKLLNLNHNRLTQIPKPAAAATDGAAVACTLHAL